MYSAGLIRWIREFVGDMQVVARRLADKPNYWIPRECMGRENSAVRNVHGGLRELAEHAVDVLFKRCVEPLLARGGIEAGEWAGAEYWAQVYTGGRGLEFHFDKDEHAMKTRGEMRTPILSSVLYCTGTGSTACGKSKSWRDALQSPTIVTDQHFDAEKGVPVPASPTSSTMVFPKENRYCVFGGNCGHGVLDSGNEDERITFLVNWWRQKPESIQRCPENEVLSDDAGAARVEKAMQSLVLGRKNASSKSDDTQGNGDSREADVSKKIEAAETYSRQTLEETQQEHEEEEDIVVVRARAEDFDDPMIVDDFLALRNVHLCGSDTPAAVTIEHKGLMLCPIEVVKDSNEIIHVCGALLKED